MAAQNSASRRHWFTDGASAIAFLLLAYFLTRGAKNALGPIPALFVFAVTAGTGWAFARSAWRGICGGREDTHRQRLDKHNTR